MPPDRRIAEGVRAAAERLERGMRPISPAEVRARRSGSVRHMARARVAAALVVLVVAIGLVAAVLAWPESGRREAAHVQAGDDGIDLEPGACGVLAPSPLTGRSGQSAVWTGTEMIVWGGTDGRPRSDGAAYDPRARRWRAIADAPIAGRSDHEAAWTGTEMLIWGGSTATGARTDGAAYDPATDSWRQLPAAPMEASIRPPTVWTGNEWVLAQGRASGGPGGGAPRVVAYDPSADSWRQLPEAPVARGSSFGDAEWTGTHVVLTVMPPFEFSTEGSAGTDAGLVAFDPTAESWQVVTGVDLRSVGDESGRSIATPRLVKGHDDLFVLSGPEFPSYTLDLSTLASRRIAQATTPLPGDLDFAANDEIVLWSSGLTSAYRPELDEWSDAVPTRSPATLVQGESGVWTGQTYLVWGGFVNNLQQGVVVLADGVAYRPSGAGGLTEECSARQQQASAAAAAPSTAPTPATVPSTWQRTGNAEAGVLVALPPSWKRHPTRRDASPAEVLSFGTGLGPEGSLRLCAPTGGPPDQVTVVINELVGSPPYGYSMISDFDYSFSDRPNDFARSGGGGGECIGPDDTSSTFRTWTFQEQGRHFAVTATLGPAIDDDDLVTVFDVLNTLRIDPLDASYTLPENDLDAIRNTLKGWLDATTLDEMAPYIENPASFEYEFSVAAPLNAGGFPPTGRVEGLPYTGRIDQIQGLTPDSARIVFSILDANGNAFVDHREGRAVRRADGWKISRETICGYLALRWATCSAK